MQPPNPYKDPWADKCIRFDGNAAVVTFRPGEDVIDTLEGVEDTKGNNGVEGKKGGMM